MTLRERIASWVTGGTATQRQGAAFLRRLVITSGTHPDRCVFVSTRSEDGRRAIVVDELVRKTIWVDLDPDSPDRISIELEN